MPYALDVDRNDAAGFGVMGREGVKMIVVSGRRGDCAWRDAAAKNKNKIVCVVFMMEVRLFQYNNSADKGFLPREDGYITR